MSARRAVGLFVRLALYYTALAGAAWLLARWIPVLGSRLSDRSPVGASLTLLGALAIISPVAWTYMRTKPAARYDASLVQTVIVLPIVIAGVVLIVRDSVALAFSLAGIVAAVRFRNTLRDTKDAVYIFLAIAVGLAAGVQAFGVAFVVSAFFVALTLVLWRFDVGATAATAHERIRGRLLIEAPRATTLEPALEALLERHARSWKLSDTAPGALTFAVQLKRRSSPDALLADVRRDPDLQDAVARFDVTDQ
jgi:hypothetical protein